jgi:hypothetical protein
MITVTGPSAAAGDGHSAASGLVDPDAGGRTVAALAAAAAAAASAGSVAYPGESQCVIMIIRPGHKSRLRRARAEFKNA